MRSEKLRGTLTAFGGCGMPGQDQARLEQTKLCSTCSEFIHVDAKKCKVCESYQDWRRFLPLGSMLLPMLVALVSVLGLVTPIVANALRDQNSAMAGYWQAMANNRAFIVVTNDGIRPGSLVAVRLTRREVSGTDLPGRYDFQVEPQVVRPGESRQITVELGAIRCQLDQASEFLWDDRSPRIVPTFQIKFRDFQGHIREERFEPRLSDILRSTQAGWQSCAAERVDQLGLGPTAQLVSRVRRECPRPLRGSAAGGGHGCW
jgi:hypothetical protein